MVLHNPNNWHWVSRNASEWTKEWLQENLCSIKAEKGDTQAAVTKVSSLDGDVDVAQRKGKVITIYDFKLVLDIKGSTEEDDNVTGSITIPEVMHDTTKDEYVFEIDIHDSSNTKQPVKDLIRSDILPQLRQELQKLGPALIAEHGKDLQHAPGQGPPTGYVMKENKVTSSTAAQANAKSTVTTTQSSGKAPKVNTVPVNITAEFRTSAAELFTTFTDPQRITAFTRSPPTVWEGAKPNGKFTLFGGGVSGEYISLKEPSQIVQKWRLAQWIPDHYSNLTLTFDQDNVNGVTNMRADFGEVPVGEEESTEQRFNEYYVRSLKTTFGFGTIL